MVFIVFYIFPFFVYITANSGSVTFLYIGVNNGYSICKTLCLGIIATIANEEDINVALFSYTRAFGDPRIFERIRWTTHRAGNHVDLLSTDLTHRCPTRRIFSERMTPAMVDALTTGLPQPIANEEDNSPSRRPRFRIR
ncbi:hypothetical protein TNCV_4878561 [Trichonephila clavipes]|nr:hypothetical protein TNCV_4878561 [Trichonephila clavipes]